MNYDSKNSYKKMFLYSCLLYQMWNNETVDAIYFKMAKNIEFCNKKYYITALKNESAMIHIS